MKKFTLFLSAMLLACATNLWAEEFSKTYSYGSLTDWSLTNYSDKDSYYLVPTGNNPSIATIVDIFADKQISSNVVITLNVATYGSGTNPSASSFSIYTSSNCSTQVTANQSGKLPTSSTYTDVTYTVSKADAIALTKDLAIKITKPGKQIRLKSITITFTYETPSTATLTSIEIAGNPTKTSYMAGDVFCTDGLKVMGNYDDETQKEITEGITWEVTPATLTAGLTQVEVKATVGDFSTTRTITSLTVTAAKTLTSIAVSGTPAEFWKGDTFNHDGMTVTAKWDDNSTTDVTAEAEFSTPDMATAGVKTITVTYKEQTATYDITVKTIANTQETAYTVAEAIALIDAGKDLTANVYVKGTISQIDGYSSNTITYWLDTNTFMVFRGKGLAGEDFTAVDNVVKGAEVIVYGHIAKFGSTYEFITGNYLASYTARAVVKKDPTLTLGTYKTSMDANEVNDEYSVTYDGDGTLSVTSSNEEVAMVTIDGTNIVVDALTEGTTTISVSAAETDTYYFVEKKYTLTVYPAWVATSLPFEFDGGKNDINQGNGMKQNGIENKDYDSSPKLKFGETGASLIIWFNETAASVSYSIKGNPSNNTWSGTFDVLESEDNQKYDTLATHDNLKTTILTETKTLSSSTRYIKFVYSKKVLGNVALGAIKIVKPSTPSAISSAAVETPAVKTIENGQLVIIRDGVKYNAMGVRLQ